MTPLPPPLGTGEIRFWRLDDQVHAQTWDSGEGSFRVGGRWNSPGVRAVYASLDPSTAILEVAVHKTFRVLDTKPHVMTSARITDPGTIHVVKPVHVPNPNWLAPCPPNTNQQKFGDNLLAHYRFILIPSAVSPHSWNLIFNSTKPSSDYKDVKQERFALDPRLQD
ncbi:type II RES/Xre toxin-antitoxin system toxin [Oricola nitratireducens]|uniref:type II RES/Xre toxin-antitoxin system toxin n=1 Tax=Oricola nitratireducens TaxID=2775868 RepID=UPI0018682BD2